MTRKSKVHLFSQNFSQTFIRESGMRVGMNQRNKERYAQTRLLSGVHQSSEAWCIQIGHWLRCQQGFSLWSTWHDARWKSIHAIWNLYLVCCQLKFDVCFSFLNSFSFCNQHDEKENTAYKWSQHIVLAEPEEVGSCRNSVFTLH